MARYHDQETARLRLREVFGLEPPLVALREAVRGLRGDPYAPGHAFDLSSLRILEPRLSLRTWAGRTRADRRVPIYNFFNRAPAPDGAFSVRKTTARDFMGGQRTYDSHKATDFVVPVGTPVVAAAPGRVVRIAREFDRGGLHVCVDHGRGVFTTASHLARPLVEVGQEVGRGEVIALSGAAGLDFVAVFPWNVPHIHYNVWLNGEPVDPFCAPGSGEVSMWRTGDNEPVPHRAGDDAARGASEAVDAFAPTAWDMEAVEVSIARCVDPALRARLDAVQVDEQRAAEVLFQRNYRPTRFAGGLPSLYARQWSRASSLDLPLRAEEFSGITLDTRW